MRGEFFLKFRLYLHLAVALLFVFSCSAQTTPLESSIGGNVYTNFFFRFRYEFSSSWVSEPVSMVGEMEKRDREGNLPDSAKAPNSYELLRLVRTLPGQGPNGRSRALISLTAEQVPARSEITDGKEAVLKFTNKLKKQRYTPVGKLQELPINGHAFFRQDMKGKSEGAEVYQSGVFTVCNGYVVGFLLTSPTQSLLDNMASTLDKIQFF
jgi:hypothetical protein